MSCAHLHVCVTSFLFCQKEGVRGREGIQLQVAALQPHQVLAIQGGVDIFSDSLLLKDALGDHPSLASLAIGGGGFRVYLKEKANEIGVTGTIQRYNSFDIRVTVEGTEQQLRSFYYFLDECIAFGMISDFQLRHQRYRIDSRQYQTVLIATDFQKSVENGGTLQTGQYSGDDGEKKSVNSSDSASLSLHSAP